MAFQQGLSGLNSSSKSIDVISNNIANASTVGFKSSQAHFADVYAASLQGAGASQVGIGVGLSNVFQQFTQGNITTTNNALDISINGGGFYRMSDNGAVTYTRNGQFHVDKDGFVVNDGGLRLTGYLADPTTGTVSPSTPGDLVINASDIAPVATGASTGNTTPGVVANLNLDSRALLPPTTPWPLTAAPPPPGVVTISPLSYNFSTAQSIYDSLGNPHNLTYYFVKTPNPSEWEVHATVDGTREANIDLGAGFGNPLPLVFDASGKLDPVLSPAQPTTVIIDLDAVVADLQIADPTVPGNAAEQFIGRSPPAAVGFDLNFAGTTQYGSAFGVNSLSQDGYSSGRLAGISVAADGILQGRYTNGQTQSLGQVVLANFRNPNGLQALGDNQWAETSESGGPLVGVPGSASLGVLQSSSVEESNVDMTNELVAMITAQRNYQANAQSIKTQDQIMNTIVNLR